jgi:glycosyltransferase involved in cell wall biosynthesis
MLSKIILTLAIPTFNRESYLSELLNQIGSDLICGSIIGVEILVVNNASTDRTDSLVLGMSAEIPSLRYIKNSSNIGGDRNFMNCVSLARGEYVWLFGDDEIYLPGAIKSVLSALESKPALLIVESEFCERIEATSYWDLLRKVLPVDPIFQVHHTLITKNIFPKSSFDFEFAISMVDSNFSHIYGLMSHLSNPGKVTVFSKWEPAFKVRTNRPPFEVEPVNLEKKLIKLAFDFSAALKASQLYRGTWMYYKARPIYNLVHGKTLRRIKLRWFSKSS